MNINIPVMSLVALIGASGSGKSTFARRHFKPTEVLSSDFFRGMVSDDENSQAASNDAFDTLYYVAAKRLSGGKMVVIDATNVQQEDRKPLLSMAREHHVLPVAIVFNLPEHVCHERNAQRPDRQFGRHVVRGHRQALRRSLRSLGREGFRYVFHLDSVEAVDAAIVTRTRLWNDRRDDHGPFDIIGDIHGCGDELEELLTRLGYAPDHERVWRHSEGRRAVFLGDLTDRGPRSLDVLRIVMSMVEHNVALCVPGNHDVKLLRKLRGKNVQIKHGLEATLAEFDAITDVAERASIEQRVARFIDGLVSHYVLDDGRLVVAHAGMKQSMQGRASGAVREFALYGETTGETDEFGLPLRYNWAGEYRGEARVVYGHTPVPEPQWLNRTINIDTGCVFGGALTALRYPEMEMVSVAARRTHAEPARPIAPLQSAAPVADLQQQSDDVLDFADVSGKRVIATRLARTVTIRESNAAAALEVMSRFAVDPRWIVYLPPTMSPVETSTSDGFLEHPDQALAYYRDRGVSSVICQEKHMGSRAVVIVCRDADAARGRFGVDNGSMGACLTRTGRRFFNEPEIEQAMLGRIAAAAGASELWRTLESDWMLLDCELMPWSAKALALLREQYAAVGAAARMALPQVALALEQASGRGIDVNELSRKRSQNAESIDRFTEAYRRYCWDVRSIDDYRLAPFHLLASGPHVHDDRDHLWHMSMIERLCACDSLLFSTPHRVVDLHDSNACAAVTAWWLDLVLRGGEGMVVKPVDFIARNERGLLQPAVKCRGPEYLRIIYGPEYDRPEHLSRLRHRGLAAKRSLAVREFALGLEALHRFVEREPLRRIHECVFGVMALESTPVDPRL